VLARGGCQETRPVTPTSAQVFVGFDVETHPIKPGLLAPRLVCMSYAIADGNGGYSTGLVLREDAIRIFRQWLLDPRVVLVAHNATFDVGVFLAEDPDLVPLVFEAYCDHRIRCTARRQEVIDVAAGMRKFRRTKRAVTKTTYALVDLLKLYFDQVRDKTDTWQLRYGLLDGVPIEQWPPDAVSYAIDDSIDALRIYDTQTSAMVSYFGEELPNQSEQQQASFALHLQSMWGLRAERKATEHFVHACQVEIAKMEAALKDTALLKLNRRGEIERTTTGAPSKSTKEIQARVVASFKRLGLPVPMTDPSSKFPDGQIRTNTDTLLLTDDQQLHALAAASTFIKHLGQWGPVLAAACLRVVCVRYQTLMENGRTSCGGSEGQEGTNIQNPPRKGEVRPCFIPRIGWVYCSSDADTVELRALAFACLKLVGYSRMAEVLKRQAEAGGPDLHVTLAAAIAGISVEAAHALHLADDAEFANTRQLAKHVNFALAGGAGAQMFVIMAHGFGICLTQSWATAAEARATCGGEVAPVFSDGPEGETITRWVSVDAELDRAEQLRQIWFETWPEMRPYFAIIGNMVREQDGTIRQLVSGRIRGDVRFTAAANSFFSGLVADAMKDCCWVLAYECYTGRCYWCRGSCSTMGADGVFEVACTRCGGHGTSPLHGSRPSMFLHDEPILEHPEGPDLRARAERQERTVVWCLEKWMPGIPFSSSYVVTRRWQKGAKRLKDDPAAPVRPEKYVGADGKPKTRWVLDELGGGARPVGALAS
jgi:hypothetical protein